MRRKLRKDLKEAQSIELNKLFCTNKEIKTGKNIQKTKRKKKTLSLAPFIKCRFHIRFRYKEKLYIAHVRKNASIMFAKESAEFSRLQGKVFLTPSSAAKAVTKRAMNGWKTWTYERAPGDWVLLKELRK